MARVGSLGRRVIVVAYIAVFWALLPLALIAIGQRLDAALGHTFHPSPWGWPLLVCGLGWLAWAMLVLWSRGHGLPVSALPPPRLVVSGPYGIVRHPIYLGYNVALVGLALVLGSTGLLLVGGPVFLVGWVVYALVEERGLRRRFGAEYAAYQSEVAIWPRLPLYRIAQALIAAGVLPVTVEGRSHVPRGAYVIVANHACYLDPAFLTRVTWRRIRFLATAETFRSRGFGWLMRRAGAIPLRRYCRDLAACRALVRHLAYGEIAGVFVEGERSPLGIYEGAIPRVAAVLARLGVPVVPVGICGSYDAGPRWSGVLRRRHVTLRIGPPVVFAGRDPALAIDTAITALIGDSVPLVHLAGLAREPLRRVLWACPRCLDESHWDIVALRCGSCGANFQPTEAGLIVDQDGHIETLAALGQRLMRAAPAISEIACSAQGYHEPSMTGPTLPLESLGIGTLSLTRTALSFTPQDAASSRLLIIPVDRIRSVSTERADTLQVATTVEMWQFRPVGMSVFRLQRILEDWTNPRLRRPRRVS